MQGRKIIKVTLALERKKMRKNGKKTKSLLKIGIKKRGK